LDDKKNQLVRALGSPPVFAAWVSGLKLREYQKQAAGAVIDSVFHGLGRSIAVIFPRQSGKNELQAQLEVYLLALLQVQGAEIVKISPTWRPQSLNAMRRLERVLDQNSLTRGLWVKESGYIYRLGNARISFLSGAPESNIVGATASTLLEVDEAQDVRIDKFDKEIAPMAASTDATRVFWGTAWTSQTLLARELRAARAAEAAGGPPRAFVLSAEAVGREAPEYARFVAGQVARLGRFHPLVRTQFFSEEIDEQGGMFPPARLALMRGRAGGRPGGPYALLLDVAGEEEGGGEGEGLANPRRDATALTVAAIDLSTLGDPLLRAPTYRPVLRRQWMGVKHARLYGEIRALAEAWQARFVVVDATGVGAGLASFLSRALPGRVIPFIFTAASKSQLGWDFLALVDGGRWQEPDGPAEDETLRGLFLRQLSFCQYEVLPGPGKVLRWGTPDGARDPLDGTFVHDDLVISAALAAVLDRQEWPRARSQAPGIIRAGDPLDEMRGF